MAVAETRPRPGEEAATALFAVGTAWALAFDAEDSFQGAPEATWEGTAPHPVQGSQEPSQPSCSGYLQNKAHPATPKTNPFPKSKQAPGLPEGPAFD